ncbi:MAG: hypothetical protein KC505_04690 [Myxococcales bacterium]|nr:hypothetical protein [Myxococcales bacterium]USN49810.1 MAG: hypothetical protein H6731_05875 [Myxococcales bacterium]
MKNKIASIFFAFVVLISSFLLIINYPQWYYFEDNLEYKQFRIFYDKPISKNAVQVLDRVEELIKQSSFFEPNLKFKIFLRNDPKKYNIFPFQFNDKGFGQTIQFVSNNIFINHCDLDANISFSGLSDSRDLVSVIAHEIVHVLIEKQFGYFARRIKPLLIRSEFSSFGYQWKEEGYAEHIAGGSPGLGSLGDGVKTLKRNDVPANKVHHAEYFKYWLAVKYLLEAEKITQADIFLRDYDLEELVLKATSFYEKQEKPARNF